ncbi:MAG: DUF4163 domain-containing protein [Prevotellaceae bacterium]|jgi:hypothetical protein|nr:DUF4163 domain-containing protein [Prevotellaceae bacterium]
MRFHFLNFSIATTTFVRIVFAVAAITTITFSCQTAPEHISYTTISATLNDPVTIEGNKFYPKQVYRYPQLSNMSNAIAQDSLNRMFRLADYDALQADTQYTSVELVDNVGHIEQEYLYSFEWIQISYLNDELISYSGMQEYSGGAHPSYTLCKARTIALNTLQPMLLQDLLVGDYKSFFKEKMAASEQLSQFVSNGVIEYDELGSACNDILDVMLQQIDTVSTTANMLVSDTALSILQADFRDYGCPEVMRSVIEVRIPYYELAPYINPKGYLRNFLK